MRTNKKGAIELSMTTIIVIVLGVTLLILGIAWVEGMFEKVITLTDEAFRSAQKEVQDKMGSSEKFYVSGLAFDIESGKDIIVYVGVQNFGDPGESNTFKIRASSTQVTASEWFNLPDPQVVLVGDKAGLPLGIKVPKGTPKDTSYPFTIEALKDNTHYASQAILVRVK